MEVHIYSSIKAIVATDIVKDIVTIQKAKAKRKSARDLKNFVFCQKIQQRASGPQESATGVTYL